jgi:hypothetical protein
VLGVEAALIAAPGVFIEHVRKAQRMEHIRRRKPDEDAPLGGLPKHALNRDGGFHHAILWSRKLHWANAILAVQRRSLHEEKGKRDPWE